MYIEFTEEEKRRASEADLVDLLERCGQPVKRVGSQYEWMDGDQTVSIIDNLWFHQYERVGGTTIGFVQKFMGMNYPEAVKFILGEEAGVVHTKEKSSTLHRPREPKEFILPPRNQNMNRVFAYLIHDRGLDPNVLRAFAHAKLIYENEQYHNVVFVGTDKTGKPMHAHKRSTAREGKWRANQAGSDARFSFNWRGRSNKVYLFEAPIDMLSYISMHPTNWSENTYIAACSLSDQPLMQMLQDRPDINQVFLCFDNDPPGQKAAKHLREMLFAQGINSEILVPSHKDWNEDLLVSVQEVGDVECQTVSQLL